jgi:predicted nucleic acid-binding protein
VISFDTNILVYAADRLAGERHRRAFELLQRAMRRQICLQPLQSFTEFFHVVTRKSGVDPAAATTLIDSWIGAVTVEAAEVADLTSAMRAVREYRLAFWDAMLWATVRRAGVLLMISEDFQDGRLLEGVRFANPFLPDNDELIDRELSR